MPEESLESLLSAIPLLGQPETGATLVSPDKKARAEDSSWKGRIKETQHTILTWALWSAFVLTGFIALIRGLHLVLPEKPLYIFGALKVVCWLTEKQLSAIDHLLVSGAFVAAVGAGRSMLSKASPYDPE